MSRCVNFHRTSSVAVSDENLLLTFSDNPTGVASLTPICFVICQNIPSAGLILPLKATINGATVPIYNKYSIVATGSDFRTRRRYRGYYVENNGNSYIIVDNAPVKVCGCGGC